MKKTTCILLFIFVSTLVKAQHSWFSYSGGFNPRLKSEKALKAKSLSDLMPDFCQRVILSYNDRLYFDEQVTILNSKDGAGIYPQDSYFTQADFLRILHVETIEMTVIHNGKNESLKAVGTALSVEQRQMLSMADVGTDLSFNFSFKFKHPLNEDREMHLLKTGKYTVSLVPEKVAEYAGGNRKLNAYLIEHIITKFPDAASIKMIQQAAVKFVINKSGDVTEVKMANSTGNVLIDHYIINAVLNMPKWKAAEDTNGNKINQCILIPFGGEGC